MMIDKQKMDPDWICYHLMDSQSLVNNFYCAISFTNILNLTGLSFDVPLV